ncbi:Centromere protein L [Eufriesea mexicana]|uniref:Centromere protein L n=1 Tax=Eufriesea mexicana TaxID=516756 RepID=A0A310SEQ0_9HYME|nr:Centromere protein L [Eufriesea mexicana]
MESILPHASHIINTMCTPRTRTRQRFSLELLNKTWTIFGVSMLFNFHQDEIHLKQYAKRLKEEVTSKLSQEAVVYDVEFCVMENVTQRPSPLDPPPIKVEVYAENSNIQESSKKCIYKGIFLSWRTTKNIVTIFNSVTLPLLLCRGTRSAIGVVHNTLSLLFDCMIISLSVQEDDLIWLVAIVITPTNKEQYPKSTDVICMEYKIPELPDSDTITIKFKILDLIKILTVIVKDQSDEASVEISFNLEHVENFREFLYSQMLKTAGLQLGLCTLYKINLPTFSITGNRMKVMNPDTMNRVLLYLNEKALDILHTLEA